MSKFLKIALLCACCYALPTALAAQTSTTVTQQTVSLETTTVKVSGVGCSTDIRTISAKVRELEGVTACEAAKRGAVTRFEVSYNPDLVCLDDIRQAVEQTPGCKNPNARPYRVKL